LLVVGESWESWESWRLVGNLENGESKGNGTNKRRWDPTPAGATLPAGHSSEWSQRKLLFGTEVMIRHRADRLERAFSQPGNPADSHMGADQSSTSVPQKVTHSATDDDATTGEQDYTVVEQNSVVLELADWWRDRVQSGDT
jgi:hypothetical protein